MSDIATRLGKLEKLRPQGHGVEASTPETTCAKLGLDYSEVRSEADAAHVSLAEIAARKLGFGDAGKFLAAIKASVRRKG